MNAATTQGLVHYSAARVALQKAHAIDEVKAIKDKAEAMRVYAAQANDVEMQNMCVEIKLRAQRKIGQMLIDMNPRPGRIGHNGGTNSPLPDEVTRNQSSKWQKLAAIPDDVFERVVVETVEKTGELTQAAVLREVVLGPIREAKERELTLIEALQAKAILGLYDVVVIDPPWPLNRIERDVRPEQVAFDYPVMDVEQIASEVGGHLAEHLADNAHIFLWSTQKYLPASFDLIEQWNLAYAFTMVWHKNGGFQPFGQAQFNCEFVVCARRGSPIFLSTKDFPACFDPPRTKHSEKPEAFYATLRRVTGGRRLDMFNRREIAGFDGWGKEALASD